MSDVFNPENFGMNLDMTADNLIQGRKAYVQLVETLKGKAEKAEPVRIEMNDETEKTFDAFVSDVQSFTWETLADKPEISVVLFEELRRIQSEVKEYRDWYKASLERAGKSAPVSVDESSKNIGEKLADYIRDIFSAFSTVHKAMPDKVKVPNNFDKVFPVKTNKAGEVLPDLPRLPYAERGNAGNPGKVAIRQLRYRWTAIETGETIEIPAGTCADDVVMLYINRPDYRYARTAIFDMLPKVPSGKDFKSRKLTLPADGESVILNFNSGELEVWLPTGTTVEEVSLDENNDD